MPNVCTSHVQLNSLCWVTEVKRWGKKCRNLEDKGWETFGNISFLLQISEKQRTLYEALERQQKYQDSLQSISTKMEAIEMKLSESLEQGRSPESQMAEHQVRTVMTSASCLSKTVHPYLWLTGQAGT